MGKPELAELSGACSEQAEKERGKEGRPMHSATMTAAGGEGEGERERQICGPLNECPGSSGSTHYSDPAFRHRPFK